MAVGKRCLAPEHGGSAAGACRYILGYTLVDKAATPEEKEQAQDAYRALMREASMRADHGVGVILKPGGNRPSAIYARNVGSLQTAALEMDALGAANGRVKCTVRHDLISFSQEESKHVSDETAIECARRAMDGLGYADHPAVYVVHRDTDHAHVHIATSSVSPLTLRAPEIARDYDRLAYELRKAEIELGLQHDHGAYVVRVGEDGTKRIERATRAEKAAWKRELREERLEALAREYLEDAGGLELPEDRRDRIVFDIRTYLDRCAERGERPLQADLHRIAAEQAARLEQTDGTLKLRLMERTAGGEVRRHQADDFGELQPVEARSRSTHHVFELDPAWLAPSPLDVPGTATAAPWELEQHDAALARRSWLQSLGDVEASELELAHVIRADPGRPSRDLIAGGTAVFGLDDLDRWHADRVTDAGDVRALSDFVQKHDQTLVGLSLDTSHPIFTTREQDALEQNLYDRASRLAHTPDPLFNREALTQAIAEEEQANGFAFTDEQKRVFDLLQHRFAVVQGDAGVGKTSMMSVVRRYSEKIGRPIAGFATAQLAAENLGNEAQIRTVNTARAAALEEARGEHMVEQRSINILDETSMVSINDANSLLERIEQEGAIALTIGDEAQLPNIDAGDTMRLLAAAAKRCGQHAQVTTVFRQKLNSDVAWMREAVPQGGRAIRDGDAHAVREYFAEYWDRGHVVQHETKRDEVTAKAHDIVECARRGERTIATGLSHKGALYVNRAIRSELGHEGTGHTFRFTRGLREIAVGDRVVFTKNAEKKLGVLNGYTGTVRELAFDKTAIAWTIGVELDGGAMVRFDPAKYNHLDYGWAVTTHKAQGQGNPIALPTITAADNARSAHVALTRCQTGLRVHTTLTRDEFLDRLSSPESIRPAPDALLYHELERRTGGPDTPWARAMRRAQRDDKDPVRQAHRAFLREQRTAFLREAKLMHDRYAKQLREIDASNVSAAGKKAAQRAAYRAHEKAIRDLQERYKPLSIVKWGAQNRARVERIAGNERTVERVRDERAHAQERSVSSSRARFSKERTKRRSMRPRM